MFNILRAAGDGKGFAAIHGQKPHLRFGVAVHGAPGNEAEPAAIGRPLVVGHYFVEMRKAAGLLRFGIHPPQVHEVL